MERMLQNFKLLNKKDAIWWLFFSGLIIFEYLLFRGYILREIAVYYPANSDQTVTLSGSYLLFESILSIGFLQTLKSLHNFWAYHWNTGSTLFFPVQAAVFFVFFGASRLSALTINFFYFILLQFIGAKIIKSLSNNYYFPFLFIGLLLTTLSPIQDPGGLTDFRLDFIAFCLYGVFAISVMKSQVFIDRKWSIITMLLAVITISFRLITLTYIIPILIIWYGYLLVYKFYAREREVISIINKQICNLLIAISGVSFISVVICFILRKVIYNYYVIGHVTGNEKYVRAQIEGVNSAISNLLYYPRSVIFYHLGLTVFIISISLLSVLFLTSGFTKKIIEDRKIEPLFFWQIEVFLLSCILVPIIILTTDLSKSCIVGSIVIVPFLLMVTVAAIYLYQNSSGVILKKYVVIAFVTISMALGLNNYLSYFGRHNTSYYHHDAPQLTRMYQDIGDYAVKERWGSFSIMVDQVNDYANDGALSSLYYEKTGILLDVNIIPKLNTVTFTAEEAKNQLGKSHVFIANLDNYTHELPYSFNVSIASLRPELREYAEKTFLILGDYPLANSTLRVYVKSSVRIFGITDDGWVIDKGLQLEIPSVIAKRVHKILLFGVDDFKYLPNDFRVFATAIGNDGAKLILPAVLQKAKSNNYIITLAFPECKSIQRVLIGFSNYFIPQQLGINQDLRKLVFRAPIRQGIFLKESNKICKI